MAEEVLNAADTIHWSLVGFKSVLEARLETINAIRQQRASWGNNYSRQVYLELPAFGTIHNSIPLFDCCDP